MYGYNLRPCPSDNEEGHTTRRRRKHSSQIFLIRHCGKGADRSGTIAYRDVGAFVLSSLLLLIDRGRCDGAVEKDMAFQNYTYIDGRKNPLVTFIFHYRSKGKATIVNGAHRRPITNRPQLHFKRSLSSQHQTMSADCPSKSFVSATASPFMSLSQVNMLHS